MQYYKYIYFIFKLNFKKWLLKGKYIAAIALKC